MITPRQLHGSPNALAQFYSRFGVSKRILLTGHSHQAWPDCGYEAQQQAWMDAAVHLDRKWELAFAKAEMVRSGFARLLEDAGGEIALGASTHDLLIRFLSALPLRERPRIVTTDGEFHSLRRQLDRIAEEGIEIARVRSSPSSEVPDRLMDAIDDRTAAVMLSSVFFQTGEIVPGLSEVLNRCRASGAEFLIDAYHSLNVVPFSLKRERLEDAFVVGGGYKYCQLGEGNCFLRFPKGCHMRPLVTGWFSEFDLLESDSKGQVFYGPGHARFAGSTYDPVSHYRAAAVFSFFEEMGLTPGLLREVSQHQIRLIAERFDSLNLDPAIISRNRSVPIGSIGGFMVLRTPHAKGICNLLHDRGIHTDFREDFLRLGPAPYLSDQQLMQAMDTLAEICRDNLQIPESMG